MTVQPVIFPTAADLGANEFTLTGDRTSIIFFPTTPGPLVAGHEGGELQYIGPEGNFTFYGTQIERQDSAIGALLTVTLRPNADTGAIRLTVVIPKAFDVTRELPLSFSTFAVKTTSRGFINLPGVNYTYTLLPLLGQARDVLLPL
jgi:hypothetical protein